MLLHRLYGPCLMLSVNVLECERLQLSHAERGARALSMVSWELMTLTNPAGVPNKPCCVGMSKWLSDLSQNEVRILHIPRLESNICSALSGV